MRLGWYVRRLSRMTPTEMVGRTRDVAVKRRWRSRQVRPGHSDPAAPRLTGTIAMAGLRTDGIDLAVRAAVVAAADALLDGHWPVFERVRDDMADAPDWFVDPRTGLRAPADAYAFDIDHRDEDRVGNVKYVWEMSRHTHLTVSASAYHLTGDTRYAELCARHLRSWWSDNPFLSGIHWTSGIEVGLRLIAWTWIRRLLATWPEVTDLFDGNPEFLAQLHHHQEYLSTLPSRGSSANNHLVAEAAGLFVAATAVPCFAESPRWRAQAADMLRRALPEQVPADGVHRELASEYHGFVFELALLAALEGQAAGHGLGPDVWQALARMADALAGMVDAQLQPPRQGDGDEGNGLLVDAPGHDRWDGMLTTAGALFGALDWWPATRGGDVRTALLTALAAAPPVAAHRPSSLPTVFAASGQVLLRRAAHTADEIWCRFDAGPHGARGIAAHAHADALSIEVRHGGVDVIADPGTYCYHGERPWRDWFRSTRAHATLELDGVDQSVMGGPFLWIRQTDATLLATHGLDGNDPQARASARHDGYARLSPPATHERTVELDRATGRLTVTDRVATDGTHQARLVFPLGPDVDCRLDGTTAYLRWTAPADGDAADRAPVDAQLRLPAELSWTTVRGDTEPIAGWHSPAFDRRVAATAVVGTGHVDATTVLRTELHSAPIEREIDTTTATDGARAPRTTRERTAS